jgi:hypothetical protein
MNEPQPASIVKQEEDRLEQAATDKAAHEAAVEGATEGTTEGSIEEQPGSAA